MTTGNGRTSGQEGHRRAYIDLLRIFAAFCVVLMHTAADGLRYDVSARPGWLCLAGISSLTFCAVPLFFMISGYLVLGGSADPRQTLFKRLPRLFVPLLFWSCAHVMFTAHMQGKGLSFAVLKDGITQALQRPVNVSFWFIYTLAGMYLISPFLSQILKSADRRLHKYMLGLIFSVCLLTLARTLFPKFYTSYLSFDVIDGITFFGGHLSSFILGYYLGNSKKKMSSLLLAAGALASFAVIFAGTAARSLRAGSYVQDFQSQSSFLEIFLAACIFLLFKSLSDTKKRSLSVKRSAEATFFVYLSHALMLRMYSFYIGPVPLSLSGIVLLAAAVFAAGMILGSVICLIPGVRYLVCGNNSRR